MKILLISSSPHKEQSRTFALAKEVLEGLEGAGTETEVIQLADCHVCFCLHCEACHKKILNCSVVDSVRAILEKILEADGIIIASPNYINQVTGLMKTLMDRSAHFIHCKRLMGKYVAGVVSSGSGQNKEVLDYIKFYAHTCGAQYTGSASCGMALGPNIIEEAQKLGKKLIEDIREKRVYPDQTKLIEEGRAHFKEIIKLRKNDWEQEYQYWQEKGWL
jgi:multimeric flavodoxin WrbA